MLKDEVVTDEGPSMEELVGQEDVDILTYMGWEQNSEAKQVDDIQQVAPFSYQRQDCVYNKFASSNDNM